MQYKWIALTVTMVGTIAIEDVSVVRAACDLALKKGIGRDMRF